MKKTAFVCSVALCLIFQLPAWLVSQEAGQDEQIWLGELDVKVALLRLELRAKMDAEGKLTGRMFSLDQGNAEMTIDELKIEGDKVTMELPKHQASFEGKSNGERTEVVGTWKQLGVSYPLTFKRVDRVVPPTHMETWQGTLKAGSQVFDFQLRVFDAGGKRSAKLDSFSESIDGLHAPHSLEGKQFNFEVPVSNAKFEGTLNDSGDKVDGKWIQGGGAFPLEFKKVPIESTRILKVNRPQTPKPPFDYDVTEVTVENKKDDVTLAATLTSPHGDGPFPAVVLISGSGPQDRDETIFEHRSFWVIADHLTKKGIAVLRYDERGVAKSTGDFSTATTEHLASDVGAIVDYLKGHSKIDAKRIGLVGHSEGGIIAPMLASRRNDIAVVVMLAGPGVPGKQIVLNQTRLIADASGADERTLEMQDKLLKGIFEQLDQTEDVGGQFMQKVKERMKNSLPEAEREEFEIPAMVEQGVSRMNSPWFKYFLGYDPEPALRKVKCPLLAIVGEKDLQVDPDLNMPVIERALKAGGNPDYELHRLPDLNHLFQKCETGSPVEYMRIEQTFAPEALELVSNWLVKRLVK